MVSYTISVKIKSVAMFVLILVVVDDGIVLILSISNTGTDMLS